MSRRTTVMIIVSHDHDVSTETIRSAVLSGTANELYRRDGQSIGAVEDGEILSSVNVEDS